MKTFKSELKKIYEQVEQHQYTAENAVDEVSTLALKTALDAVGDRKSVEELFPGTEVRIPNDDLARKVVVKDFHNKVKKQIRAKLKESFK